VIAEPNTVMNLKSASMPTALSLAGFDSDGSKKFSGRKITASAIATLMIVITIVTGTNPGPRPFVPMICGSDGAIRAIAVLPLLLATERTHNARLIPPAARRVLW
jgi:hypothetical protein